MTTGIFAATKLLAISSAFFRIAAVVARVDHTALTQKAARRVDVGDRLLDAKLHLGSEDRVGPGERRGDTDPKFRSTTRG